jgi:putative hydrolase of the HAD superfamily
MFRAVLLDLDNTLYDEHQFVKSGFKAVSQAMAQKFGINEKTVYRSFSHIFLKHGRKQVFTQVLGDLGIYDDEIVSEMVEVYRSHMPHISAFRDAHNVLLRIKQKCSLGLITDGLRGIQENKVKALNLSGYFDVITYADDYGGKYSPKPFLVTLEQLQVTANESVYVDDNPQKGFAVAKELGIQTVRILRGEHKNLKVDDERCKPDFEIRNLYQLENLVNYLQ